MMHQLSRAAVRLAAGLLVIGLLAQPARSAEPREVFQILAAELAVQQGDMTIAASLYLSLARETGDPQVAERATQLALSVRAPQEALVASRIWLASDPKSASAQEIVDALEVVLGQNDRLIASLSERREAARKSGTLDAFYDRLGALCLRAPKTEQGLALLEAVSMPDPDHESALYNRAMLLDRLGRNDDMERLLRRLITLKPEHAHALNALGYSLADRNQKLDEAQRLIEKAHRLLPKDAHILDSLGWVYFRQGRLQDAARWLKQAHSQQPDPEISAHLGEVYWTLNLTQEAMRVWRIGLAQDPTNSILTETLRRLGVDPHTSPAR